MLGGSRASSQHIKQGCGNGRSRSRGKKKEKRERRENERAQVGQATSYYLPVDLTHLRSLSRTSAKCRKRTVSCFFSLLRLLPLSNMNNQSCHLTGVELTETGREGVAVAAIPTLSVMYCTSVQCASAFGGFECIQCIQCRSVQPDQLNQLRPFTISERVAVASFNPPWAPWVRSPSPPPRTQSHWAKSPATVCRHQWANAKVTLRSNVGNRRTDDN